MQALIVEPSPMYHRILSRMLESYDFEVTIKESATGAMKLIDNARFQLICVAMYLPDLTGVEFCERVRATSCNADTPVFIVTSETNIDMLSSALSVGATDIIRKDDLPKLEERLHTLIPLGPFRYNVSGRALYLEDSLTIANAMDSKLKRMGLKMEHAFSISGALSKLEDHDFELIMTDIVLQYNETGIDFIRHLRNDPRYQQIPILAVTGMDSASRRVQALQAGANDYVNKPVLDEELFARIHNLISSKRLIEQLTSERTKLLELATTDHLTGLYNRHFLMEVAKRKYLEAYREAKPLTLMLIDLDFFKQINDQHGHSTGDKVLEQLARAMAEFFAEGDYLARFGGEEFVVLLTDCELEQAAVKAKGLLQLIAELNPQQIPITASIGLTSMATDHQEYFDETFARVDKALYQAKANGRNQMVTLLPE